MKQVTFQLSFYLKRKIIHYLHLKLSKSNYKYQVVYFISNCLSILKQGSASLFFTYEYFRGDVLLGSYKNEAYNVVDFDKLLSAMCNQKLV